MPYILQQAKITTETGVPLMRPMLVEFADDRTCWTLDQQYMFGSDLLVAPVFNAHGKVEFYLPAGNWTNYFTGETNTGGRWVTEQHGFDSLPLYVREGSDLKSASPRNASE